GGWIGFDANAPRPLLNNRYRRPVNLYSNACVHGRPGRLRWLRGTRVASDGLVLPFSAILPTFSMQIFVGNMGNMAEYDVSATVGRGESWTGGLPRDDSWKPSTLPIADCLR